MRYVLLQRNDNDEPFLVKVDNEQEFQDTLRYLGDCDIRFTIIEEVMTPGELSNLLAPRDD